MDRDALLGKLTALDFMTVDLGLFLDTHPDNKEALALYNKIVNEADKVRYEYEKFDPVCSFRSFSSPNDFTWIDNPWPWENQFNYELD